MRKASYRVIKSGHAFPHTVSEHPTMMGAVKAMGDEGGVVAVVNNTGRIVAHNVRHSNQSFK